MIFIFHNLFEDDLPTLTSSPADSPPPPASPDTLSTGPGLAVPIAPAPVSAAPTTRALVNAVAALPVGPGGALAGRAGGEAKDLAAVLLGLGEDGGEGTGTGGWKCRTRGRGVGLAVSPSAAPPPPALAAGPGLAIPVPPAPVTAAATS